MAISISSPSTPAFVSPLTSRIKQNRVNVAFIMADLGKSRAYLVSGLQGLKKETQNCRSKLDTQELSGLKSPLCPEMEKPRSEELSEPSDLKSSLSHDREQLESELSEIEFSFSHAWEQLKSEISEDMSPLREEWERQQEREWERVKLKYAEEVAFYRQEFEQMKSEWSDLMSEFNQLWEELKGVLSKLNYSLSYLWKLLNLFLRSRLYMLESSLGRGWVQLSYLLMLLAWIRIVSFLFSM